MSTLSETRKASEARLGPTLLHFGVVLLLCLPSIFGTTALWMAGLNADASGSHLPKAMQRLAEAGAEHFFVMAAYGPLLLIVAALLAFRVSRRSGFKSGVAIAAWTVVCLGLIAAAAFYRLLIWTARLA